MAAAAQQSVTVTPPIAPPTAAVAPVAQNPVKLKGVLFRLNLYSKCNQSSIYLGDIFHKSVQNKGGFFSH